MIKCTKITRKHAEACRRIEELFYYKRMWLRVIKRRVWQLNVCKQQNSTCALWRAVSSLFTLVTHVTRWVNFMFHHGNTLGKSHYWFSMDIIYETVKNSCLLPGSNWGPLARESDALSTSLCRQLVTCVSQYIFIGKN